MTTNVEQAQALEAVRHFCGMAAFARLLEQQTRTLSAALMPEHRLNQLATSFAWHVLRSTSQLRLEEGARELTRLWDRVGQSDEGSFYLLLLTKLGLHEEVQSLADQAQQQLDEIRNTVAGEPDSEKRQRLERQWRPVERTYRAERDTYRSLLAHLAAWQRQQHDLKQAGQPSIDLTRWLDQISLSRRTDWSEETIVVWRTEMRLRLAMAAVQMTRTLQQSAELRKTINQAVGGEAFPWL